MIAYILRRFLIAIPLLFGMTFIAFMFIQLAPGDYFDSLRLNPEISEETIALYEAKYHFDKPPIVQYFYWLKNLVTLDFGYSFTNKAPVLDVIASRALNTILLSVASILITWLVAIPIGIYCAVKQYSWSDRIFSSISFLGMSIPNFFLALLLLFLFSVVLGFLPSGGMTSSYYDELTFFSKIGDVAWHMVIPAMVIATGAMAGYQRLMRGNMLEVLRAQYVLTARAKGLPESKVIYRHALRNAINPMITIFGFELSAILSGAALTEIITSWPGLGTIMLSAVRSQDLFLVMGSALMGGILLIVGNLIADILLAWSDPRIQVQ